MEKILISACLIGDNTKYDGGNNKKDYLLDLLDFYELIPFCPEVEGGLPVPRKASEIRADRVRDESGKDVSKNFNLGAEKALSLCHLLGIKIAIMKERSPSCGVHQVHNGLFNGILVKGQGITTGRLTADGITVYNEDEAIEFIAKLKEDKEKGELAKAAAKARADNPESAPTDEKPAETKRFEGRGERHDSRPRGKFDSKDRKPYGDKRRNDGGKRDFKKDGKPHSYNGKRGGQGHSSYKGKGNGKPGYYKKGEKK